MFCQNTAVLRRTLICCNISKWQRELQFYISFENRLAFVSNIRWCVVHMYQGGLVQRWGSVCWGVVEIPVLENVPFLFGFLGCCFWLLGFKVSWFLDFKLPKLNKNRYVLLEDVHPYYQNAISCFFERYWSHIQIFKNLLNGSSGCLSAAAFFATCSNCSISDNCGIKNNVWKISRDLFLNYSKYRGVSQNK